MTKKKLTPGVGAEATILTRFLHPSELIRDKHPNQDKEWKTKNRTTVLLLGQDKKMINRKWQEVYVFRCEDYENKELYAVKRYVSDGFYVLWSMHVQMLCDPHRHDIRMLG